MNVRKFIAATARDALRKVKELLGPDAIILSNRAIPGGVEIMAVAASDMEMMVSKPVDKHPQATAPREIRRPSVVPSAQEPIRSAPVQDIRPDSVEEPALSRRDVPPLAPRPAPVFEPPIQNAVNRPSAEVVSADVMEEIRSLRRMFEQHIAGSNWGDAARNEPVKTEMLRQLLDIGFSPSLSRDLLTLLPRDFDRTKALVWVKARVEAAFQTLNADSDIIDRGGVYALVGPTGVGKTTTTAKLAARCVLRHGANKVALITTDGYRIGAYEQLRIYGRILGVSVYLCKDAIELRQTLQDLQHKHMVLIDTMGMSQRDKQVGEQVAMFEGCDVQRLLLLSATGRGDTLDDVVRAYRGAELNGCILSKVDEAAGLAASLDVIIRNGLRLHYVSNGQRVPEDLHLPNRAYLLHRAFKDIPTNSAHRLSGVEPGLMMATAGLGSASTGGARG